MRSSRQILLLVLAPILLFASARGGDRKASWIEVDSPHFVAYSDAGEAEARKALEGFEGIRSVFSQAFPGVRVDPPKPLVLLVLKDQASMSRFLPREFAGPDPKRSSGMFFSGPDRNYAILRLDVDHQVDQPYFVLFHEYTHSIVHLNFPSLPTWLDEGIADFYGATEIRTKEVYLGRVPKDRLYRLRVATLLPAEVLFKVTHDSPYYQEGSKSGIFYSQSWALVHYLFMDEQAKRAGLFQAYLKALAQSDDPMAAARAGLGDPEKLMHTLATYVQHPAFAFGILPLSVELTDKDFQVRRLDEADALLVRAEFLQYSGQEQEARPLLERALALAPGRPEIQAALGVGYLRSGDAGKAQAALEAALRLGSRDFRVPYDLATILQGGPGPGGGDSARILALLEAGLKLRPDFAGLHQALSRQYSREPRDQARSLQEGRTAVELEPNLLFHRANLGFTCLGFGLVPEAKAIGDQLNRLAATREDRQLARNYASALDQFLDRGRVETGAGPSGGQAGSPSVDQPGPVRMAPLRFSLPSYYSTLGAEVVQLVAANRTDEAIQKVEATLAKARYAYDKKVLRTLLETLRQRAKAK